MSDEALVQSGPDFALTASPQTAVQRVQDLIDALPVLAQRYEKLREVCIKCVVKQPGDWAMWGTERMGFKPRLNDGAAAKLLSFSGIRQVDNVTRKEMITLSDGKQKYIVWHEAKFISPLGGEFSALGSCASDDPFVATRYEYNEQERRRVKVQIPHEDVAYDNVVKAARANCLVNGVSALLGLKNVEPEELDALLGPGFCESVDHVGMTDRKWEPSEKQRNALLTMGATEAQVDACKKAADVDALFNQLKAAKDVRKEIKKETTSGASTDNTPASQATMNALQKMAKEKSIPWSEIDTFRLVCWGSPSTEPVNNLQAQHISRWLQNPIPPEEYAAKARQAKTEAPKQTSLV